MLFYSRYLVILVLKIFISMCDVTEHERCSFGGVSHFPRFHWLTSDDLMLWIMAPVLLHFWSVF